MKISADQWTLQGFNREGRPCAIVDRVSGLPVVAGLDPDLAALIIDSVQHVDRVIDLATRALVLVAESRGRTPAQILDWMRDPGVLAWDRDEEDKTRRLLGL
jgi:hypothetical protein